MNNQYLEVMLYESDTEPVGLPDGVTFLSDKKSKELSAIISKMSKIYQSQKYNKVFPPIFEYYETFEKGSGLNIARKSFSFKDKDGKLLSLRYDMTTPIARMASMKYEESDLPLRFYYRGDVFREQPIHAGKPRQLRQVGIEYIGEAGIKADVEIINLACESLSVLSDDFRIVIGDVRLYKNIISQLKLNESQIKAINAVFNTKDIVSLKTLISNIEGISQYKDLLLHLPYIVGTPSNVKIKLDEFSELGFNIFSDRVLDIVAQVDSKYKKNIIIDMGMIKDFSYYTSTTIEGYIKGIGYPVANGGRYDELFRSFGRDFPAIGFALDISYYQ